MENKFREEKKFVEKKFQKGQNPPKIEVPKEISSKKKPKKAAQKKFSTNDILEKINYSFSRDAVWFKKTLETIDKIKEELDQKFYSEEKKKQKIEFINKLRDKTKDYKDALNFAEMYKKIRFFERRKLERMLKKVNKQISEAEENEKERLEKEKENIVDNINYVKYYPKSYKYLSLLSKKEDTEETKIKREKMKLKIKMYLQKILHNKEKTKASNENIGDYEIPDVQSSKSKLANDDFFIEE